MKKFRDQSDSPGEKPASDQPWALSLPKKRDSTSERGFKPRGEGGYAPRGEGGFKPRTEGGFKPRTEGGFKPRTEGGYAPRGEGGFKPRSEGGFKPRTEGGYAPRGEGGFKPRGEGGFKPRTEGGYAPRAEGGFKPRGEGGFKPRPEGGYAGRSEGGFKPRGEGGFKPRTEGGYAGRSEGGFKPRTEGAYAGRSEGGFKPRSEGAYAGRSEGGFKPRSEGGFKPRSEGGFKPRTEGAYAGRSEGGFKPRAEGGSAGRSEGGFKPRAEGGYAGRSEGSFKPRGEGGYAGRSEGGFKPRSEGEYKPRRDDLTPRSAVRQDESGAQVWRHQEAQAVLAPQIGDASVDSEFNPGEQRREEYRICGLQACLRLFEQRPEALRKLWFAADHRTALGAMFSWCSEHRVGYREIDSAELERVSASSHHEGICMAIERPEWPEFSAWLAQQDASKDSLVLLLDGVMNPHNLGALLRSAAHFGVDAVLLTPQSAGLSGAVYRTAEGGAEVQPLIALPGLTALAELSAAGYRLIAAESVAEHSALAADSMPARTVLVLGAEQHGVSPAVRVMCDAALGIPGSGAVQSLNVAAAGAVLLACWRQQRAS